MKTQYYRPRSIRWSDRRIALKRRLSCRIVGAIDGEPWNISCEPFGIIVYGRARDDVIEEFHLEFCRLCDVYLCAADRILTKDAQKVKRLLREIVQGESTVRTPKPCPCCGEKARILRKYRRIGKTNKRDTFFAVACRKEICGIRTRWWSSKLAAINSWDRRAPHVWNSSALADVLGADKVGSATVVIPPGIALGNRT